MKATAAMLGLIGMDILRNLIHSHNSNLSDNEHDALPAWVTEKGHKVVSLLNSSFDGGISETFKRSERLTVDGYDKGHYTFVVFYCQ